MNHHIQFIIIFACWLVIQGCTPSLQPELESDISPDWRSEIPVNNLGTAYVMEGSERIVIGNDNDIIILDKQTGEVVEAYDDTFWRRLLPDTDVEFETDDGEVYVYNHDEDNIVHKETGEQAVDLEAELGGEFLENLQERALPLEGVMADAYTLIPHETSNTMMLFDYRLFIETVTGLDIETGDQLWQNHEFSYSFAAYSDLIGTARNAIAAIGAAATGGQAHTLSKSDERENQLNFMKSIIHEVPGTDYFLFKTFDELALIHGSEGTVEWRIDEFDGPGIAGAEVLPNGDFIVLSTGRELFEIQLADAHHLARISPEGDVRWITEHNASHTEGLYVSENHVIVDAAPNEAYDIETGEKLWENDAEYRQHRHHHIIVTGDKMYVAGDLEHRYATVDMRGWIWEHDLDTGEVLWHTEETRTEFFDFQLVDGVLLATGEGTLFGGNGGVIAVDAETGEELWKTPEFSALGWRGFVIEGEEYGEMFTKPIADEGTVYVAGPNMLYAIDLHSGNIRFEIDHTDYRTAGINDELVIHEDNIIVPGLGAVVAFNKYDGSLTYATETEMTRAFTVHDNHLVIRDGGARAAAVNLTTGDLSPVMRSGSNRSVSQFGNFSDGVYIPEHGRYIYLIQSDGFIARYSLM